MKDKVHYLVGQPFVFTEETGKRWMELAGRDPNEFAKQMESPDFLNQLQFSDLATMFLAGFEVGAKAVGKKCEITTKEEVFDLMDDHYKEMEDFISSLHTDESANILIDLHKIWNSK